MRLTPLIPVFRSIFAIVGSYPTITVSDVHAALAYDYRNREQIDTDIEEGRKFIEEMRAKAGLLMVRIFARRPEGGIHKSAQGNALGPRQPPAIEP